MPVGTLVSNQNVAILLLELAELAVDFVTDRGRGKTTRIMMWRENGFVSLKIENDGIWENQRLKLSEELLMMRSFISLVRGSLALGSDVASGTFVIAVVPEENCEG